MIGARLHAVASMVLPDRPVADVACDHARLAMSLVARGVVPHAIASDVASAPLDAARANVVRAGLRERVRLMQADGLSGLQRGEVATVCICGVGARTAITLAAPAARLGVQRLVLQANKGVPRVREALTADGWALVDERAALEGGRAYVALAFEPQPGGVALGPRDALIGPHLRARPDEAARAWWRGQRGWRVEAGDARFAEQIAWLDEALQDTIPLAEP